MMGRSNLANPVVRQRPGHGLGTAPYMSREQARAQPIDTKTDVWAFGCCLYEALTSYASDFA